MARTRTLGDILNTETYIHVVCRRCRHDAFFDPDDLYRYFGGSRAMETIGFYCDPRLGGCGGRWYDIGFQSLGPVVKGHMSRSKPRPLKIDRAKLTRLPPSRPIADPRR